MTTQTEYKYPYQPKWMPILLGGLFFTVCGGVLAHSAWNNERGLIINGILELEAATATIVYWVLAALSFVLVLLCGLQAYNRLTQFREVRLTGDSLIAPKSAWSTNEVSIPLAEITDLRQQEVNGQRFLKVVAADGKKITLVAGYLPNRRDFEQLVAMVVAAVNQSNSDSTRDSRET